MPDTSLRRVLLTDVGYKHTLAAARALSKAGYLVDVIGSKYSYASLSKYVSRGVFSSEGLTESNMENFIEFLTSESYQCLIPIGGKSVQLISENRIEIGKVTQICLAPVESINMCLNKVETLLFAEEKGVKIPATLSKRDLLNQDLSKKINFPVVIKSSLELDRFDPIYCDTFEELRASLGNKKIANSEYIVQERIKGTGEAFFGLYQEGVLMDYFMHERIREWPISGGPSTYAKSIKKDDLFFQGNLLLESLDWHGVAMVEFKRNIETGVLYLMEINPKFWGSLDLAISAGVNFPKRIVDLCSGKVISNSSSYKIGLKFQWPLDGDFKVAVTSFPSFVRFLFTLFNPVVKKNIEIRDLKPTLFTFGIKLFYRLTRMPGLRWLLVYLKRIRILGFPSATVRLVGENFGIPLFAYSQITNQIFVGAQPKFIGFAYLRFRGITRIVNLRSEESKKAPNFLKFKSFQIPVTEFSGPNKQEISQAVSWIHEQLILNKKVYIHCKEGVGRAASIVIATLIKSGFDVDQAIKIVTLRRPFVSLTDSQTRSLNQWASMESD